MNPVRLVSATARRSLPLPRTVSSTPRRFLSSSISSPAPFSATSSFSGLTSRTVRDARVSASASWTAPTSYTVTQTRTMASGQKIKVKNPVVELDGDEVGAESRSPLSPVCGVYICVCARIYIHTDAHARGRQNRPCPRARGNSRLAFSSVTAACGETRRTILFSQPTEEGSICRETCMSESHG